MHYLIADTQTWILVIAPTFALLITGWTQRHVFKRFVNRGTERLREALHLKQYKLPHQLVYQPIMGCALTIGLGGSAGAESPIAYAGAAIGSNAARFFKLDTSFIHTMVGMGAAAGIAAIFKAPLAGVFFALEVLGISLTTPSILGMVACCLISATTSFMLDGGIPEIVWTAPDSVFDYQYIWWLIPVSIIMGLYSRWYNYSGLLARSLCLKIKRPALRNLTGGLFIGIMIFILPPLYGEGYDTLTNVLNGDYSELAAYSPFTRCSSAAIPMLMLSLIVLIKGAMVFTTNNAGGVSGSFAPTLFAGGMAGMLLASGANALGCPLPTEQIAYVCMAGAMAGIIRAPLMATFITVEVTMTYSLIVPVALVAFISYWTAAGSVAWKRHQPFVTKS